MTATMEEAVAEVAKPSRFALVACGACDGRGEWLAENWSKWGAPKEPTRCTFCCGRGHVAVCSTCTGTLNSVPPMLHCACEVPTC